VKTLPDICFCQHGLAVDVYTVDGRNLPTLLSLKMNLCTACSVFMQLSSVIAAAGNWWKNGKFVLISE